MNEGTEAWGLRWKRRWKIWQHDGFCYGFFWDCTKWRRKAGCYERCLAYWPDWYSWWYDLGNSGRRGDFFRWVLCDASDDFFYEAEKCYNYGKRHNQRKRKILVGKTMGAEKERSENASPSDWETFRKAEPRLREPAGRWRWTRNSVLAPYAYWIFFLRECDDWGRKNHRLALLDCSPALCEEPCSEKSVCQKSCRCSEHGRNRYWFMRWCKNPWLLRFSWRRRNLPKVRFGNGRNQSRKANIECVHKGLFRQRCTRRSCYRFWDCCRNQYGYSRGLRPERNWPRNQNQVKARTRRRHFRGSSQEYQHG